MVLRDPHDDGWAILWDGSAEDGQRGYAYLIMFVDTTWAPGDAAYVWVPGENPPDDLPAVDPPGSKRVAGSQLQWLD